MRLLARMEETIRQALRRWCSIGSRGERQAARFLKKQGYRIVARNWRNPRDRRDEIDLVCWRHGVLVFVEVKTRLARALVTGVDAIDRRKRRVLRRTIDAYLSQLQAHDRPRTFRFDVVAVSSDASAGADFPAVRHFENVPLFSKYYWHRLPEI